MHHKAPTCLLPGFFKPQYCGTLAAHQFKAPGRTHMHKSPHLCRAIKVECVLPSTQRQGVHHPAAQLLQLYQSPCLVNGRTLRSLISCNQNTCPCCSMKPTDTPLTCRTYRPVHPYRGPSSAGNSHCDLTRCRTCQAPVVCKLHIAVCVNGLQQKLLQQRQPHRLMCCHTRWGSMQLHRFQGGQSCAGCEGATQCRSVSGRLSTDSCCRCCSRDSSPDTRAATPGMHVCSRARCCSCLTFARAAGSSAAPERRSKGSCCRCCNTLTVITGPAWLSDCINSCEAEQGLQC